MKRLSGFCHYLLHCRLNRQDAREKEGSMNLIIDVRRVEGVPILDLTGHLVAGEPVETLREAVNRLIAEKDVRFIFNVAAVPFIDSAGLGELVVSYNNARRHRGDMKLLKVTRRPEALLQLTRLATVFEVFEDETLAIGSLRQASERGFGRLHPVTDS
jgi:anti-sigma B factor antagonist